WGEYGTREGAGRFEFPIDPLSLQPGEPVCVPVALRTLPSVATPVSVTSRLPLTTPNSVAEILRHSVWRFPHRPARGRLRTPTVVGCVPRVTALYRPKYL